MKRVKKALYLAFTLLYGFDYFMSYYYATVYPVVEEGNPVLALPLLNEETMKFSL